MTAKMSKEFLSTLMGAIKDNQDGDNPFVLDGETTYMRYDEIRIHQQHAGEVELEFYWRGTAMYTMPVACDFASGERLSLRGFVGQIRAQAIPGPASTSDTDPPQ